MAGLIVAVLVLVAVGAVLAVAEAATSRMTRVRAVALHEEGRRNAGLLERIETDPPRYLNSVYLAVLLVQNGAAILVAFLAESHFGSLGITLVSVAFTLLYFVVVEAMAKTFAVLHTDHAALAVAPIVWVLGRALRLPTRALIGLANVLLPGKGLKEGPFVSEAEIRSMADVGHEEGAIDRHEKEMIHSVFEFGDTVVRQVMEPRPDVIAVPASASLDEVLAVVTEHGVSRVPIYRRDLDDTEGIIFAKDLLRVLHQGRRDVSLRALARPVHFVPESKKADELLREMQREKFHIAMVTDEYGTVSGLVTIEDLLEELVGEIADEYDREELRIERTGDDSWRVDGAVSIDELNETLGVRLPVAEWDTVGGLVIGVLGSIPRQGQRVRVDSVELEAERVEGRRVTRVIARRVADDREAAES